MKTITLTIDGMMCAHCQAHVTEALNNLSGVSAVVNLESKNAVCTVDNGISVDALKSAVAQAGYTVTKAE